MSIQLTILLFLGWINYANCQDMKDRYIKTDSVSNRNYKPEIFTSGFIDIINNGQVNASARFIRLFIGELGKFYIKALKFSNNAKF